MNETIPAPAATALADAKAKLRSLGGCALLIGVEDYAGLPAAQQLLAGRNDVLSYWKVCRRLGYRPEHIHVLTSPRLTPDDIIRAEQELAPELHPTRTKDEVRAEVERWFAGPTPVVLGDATRDAILQGVEWLASRLVFTVKLAWDDWKLEEELAALPGLFTYSGHGAHRQDDLVLCPSDVGAGLERALPFAELRALIDAGDDLRAEGTPHPADNLTVVLDCCFAAAGQSSGTLRVPTLTSVGAGPAPAPKHEIGSRVFCASGRDEHAYQGMLGGHWHGAFTWAFTRALEQWQFTPSGQFRKSTMSHVELLFRARMLLEALSFHQRPVLVDRIGNLPVFQHDTDLGHETRAEPDAERRGTQIDPSDGFASYQIFDTSVSPKLVAEIVATKTPDPDHGSGMLGGREYWRIVSDQFYSKDFPHLTVKKLYGGDWSAKPPFSADQADFSCPVDLPWKNQPGMTYSDVHASSADAANPSGFRVLVKYDYDTNAWTGWMTFYRESQEALLFKTITKGTPRSFSRIASFTQGSYYCSVEGKDIRTEHQRSR